jgi:hypothetical protein
VGIEQLNEAIRLTRKNWVIHPLAGPKDTGSSPGKRPLLNNWQNRRKATEAELKYWFEKTDNNVGLVLGKESGVLVIDFDKPDWIDVLFPPEQKILEKTLRAGRVTGRGHAYFRYTEKMSAQKLREFGIELLTSGNQVVVPPSVHREGQQYKWIFPEGSDLETFELPELPDAVIERFALLKSLEAKMRGCRKCFRWIINRPGDTMHGRDGRRLMLATATELKAHNVTLDELRLYARKVYGDGYDPKRTAQEWKNIDERKTWRCDTIQENFPEVRGQCETCLKKNLDKINIDNETTKKAIEILTTGDPIGYILDTWNRIHPGDRMLGYALLCSSLCSSISASDGLSINFSGDSAGGKYHACRSMLHLIPKNWWVRRSLRDNAIFYSSSIKPDIIFFSDDEKMSDDMRIIFRNSVSDFQEQVEHETVNIQGKVEFFKVPPRLTWWLTAINDSENRDVENHILKIAIEDNKERKKAISERFLNRRQRGEEKYPEYPEVNICRAIFEKLKSKKEKVVFNFDIKFRDGINIQNNIYEMLLATALINKYQRQRTAEGAIIAERKDFETAIDNFAALDMQAIESSVSCEVE